MVMMGALGAGEPRILVIGARLDRLVKGGVFAGLTATSEVRIYSIAVLRRQRGAGARFEVR